MRTTSADGLKSFSALNGKDRMPRRLQHRRASQRSRSVDINEEEEEEEAMALASDLRQREKGKEMEETPGGD